MYEDDMGPTWFFFIVISITLTFQIKKKIKFPKFYPCGFLWSQSVNKVLRFCSWKTKQGRQNNSSKLLKGYIRYKTIFCSNVALDV